ncbi:MAG: TonB-dependent receptor [Burkholderiaceae bacterium]
MSLPTSSRRLLALVSLCMAVPLANAQAPAALDPIVVTATRTERNPLDVPASVDAVDRETLRDARLRVNLSESLGRVPGLVVLNRQNYAQDLQLSIRGFGSRSTFGVRGVRLYVDGIPATFPDGQGQVSHFPLNAAERIEVLRGPFSALYGNSSGGVVALTTELKPQPQRFEPTAAFGAHGTWRIGLNAVGGEAPYAFAVDMGRFRTDGERDHSAARRDTLSIRTAFLDSPLGRARICLAALDMPDAQDPLGLRRDELEADPTQASPAALQFNTRKSTRHATVGADVESRLGGNAVLNTTAWLGRRSVTQFQAIPTTTQTPINHPGGVIDFDRNFGGADLRITWRGSTWTTSAGLALEREDEDRRGYQNFIGPAAAPGAVGVLGELRRAEDNRIEAADVYAQTEARIGERWRLLAGVRAPQVRFRTRDRFLANGDDSGSADYRAANPTAGLLYRATPRVAYYAAYGRGFETPTLNELAYRSDGSAGLNTGLRASRSHNVEVGAKFSIASALRGALAAFATRTDDDIVVRTNVGGRSSFANVARTRRDGVEASVEWRPAGRLSMYASAAWIDARFDADFLTCGPPPCTVPALPVASGNTLPGVPARTAFVELKYRAGWADLGAEWRAQSALFVNDRNTDRAAGYGLLALSAARTLAIGSARPRVFARVDNVLDKRYVGSVIVNEGNGRFFEPAPGRTWLVGADWPL